jgi:hypothetical protein
MYVYMYVYMYVPVAEAEAEAVTSFSSHRPTDPTTSRLYVWYVWYVCCEASISLNLSATERCMCIIIIGVVSMFIVYNCVYYCDTLIRTGCAARPASH